MAGAFAHVTLAVDLSFPGDDQIGLGNAIIQSGPTGENFEAGFQPGPRKRHQPETQSACGACARGVRAIDVMLLLQYRCQPGEALFRQLKILRAQPLLRSIDSRTTVWPQQGIGDIHRSRDLPRHDVGRRTRVSQITQPPPFLQLVPSFVEKLPAQRPRHAETGIVGRAAAEANDGAGRTRFRRRYQGSQPETVQLKGMEFPMRQPGRADDLGRVNQGRRRCVDMDPPPNPAQRLVRRVDGANEFGSRRRQFGQHRAEAVAAIAHGEDAHAVAGPLLEPARRDGQGGIEG